MKKCSVPDCSSPSRTKGFCGKHYHRYIRYGDPNTTRNIHRYPDDAVCSVDGCEERPIGNWLCSRHYRLYRKYGDPNKRRVRKKCKLSYCNYGVDSRGYCPLHYHLIRMSGLRGEFEEIFGSPPYTCHICGRQYDTWTAKELELDHILPRSKGGKNEISNLLPACVQCNEIKKALTMQELLEFCSRVLKHHPSF